MYSISNSVTTINQPCQFVFATQKRAGLDWTDESIVICDHLFMPKSYPGLVFLFRLNYLSVHCAAHKVNQRPGNCYRAAVLHVDQISIPSTTKIHVSSYFYKINTPGENFIMVYSPLRRSFYLEQEATHLYVFQASVIQCDNQESYARPEVTTQQCGQADMLT